MKNQFSLLLLQSPIPLLILLHLLPTSTSHPQNDTEFIITSCNSTTYPRLCLRSLTTYASQIKSSPKLLSSAALNVTLKSAKANSRLMKRIARFRNLKPREAAAMADCVEVVADSVEELRDSIGELGEINRYNFEMVMSDIQTWVSAALTDEDTCMDGFEERGMGGKVKALVRKRMLRFAHLISIALAIVNDYALSTSGPNVP